MQIIEKTFKDNKPLYPIEEFCEPSKVLFIDIETTGLSKENTSLYLIGCGYYSGNDFCTKLFFADDPSEELELINIYLDFSKSFTHIIHFNGTKFDVPYLEYKAKKYNIPDIFGHLEQIDVYQLSKPLRHLLFPQSMRQKCIEDFLEITRDDKYNGGELISVYLEYIKTHDKEAFNSLITHNLEDVLGMHKILPILHYLKLIDSQLVFVDAKLEDYEDYNGIAKKELYLTYKNNTILPKSFSTKTNTMHLWYDAVKQTFTFRLPVLEGEFKLFFDNYRDYYYLPSVDSCIHKSFAMGLSKHDYIKATKSNCYTKHTGMFIKQPKRIFEPVFKTEYKDKSLYFRYPESFNPELANAYGSSLLNAIIYGKASKA